MVTREQYVANCDQELATARDKLGQLVERYSDNMNHVAECPQCDEVDNIAHLVSGLVRNYDQINRDTVAVLLVVAIKTIYELRKRITE